MLDTIQVNYKYTNNLREAIEWLNNLPSLFAADFEIASRYTKKEKELLAWRLDKYKLLSEEQRQLTQKIESNGLSHPSLTYITHLSVAWSDSDSFVIITDTELLRKQITKFLVTTPSIQLWHNSVFDFKHIYYYTNLLPKSYVDTQLLAKCFLNNADPSKDKVSLKELMSNSYGDWAISKDSFVLEEQWNTETIKYAATDACAGYKLYRDMEKII